jgi:uncharacterized protein
MKNTDEKSSTFTSTMGTQNKKPPPKPAEQLTDPLRGHRRLEADDQFSFGCHKGLACFTSCCADVSIMLTPLDVLRLARKLDITTGEFLNRHTLMPITKDLGLPVLMLRMGDKPELRCPFVSDEGCGVYEDRPWSCRMYPVGMGIPPARAGEEPEPVYFLFEDDFCDGGSEPKKWTVDEWRTDQRVQEQEEMESGYRDLVSHPWFIGGRQLDPKRMEMFHTACYDLDRFRDFIFNSSFLKRFELDDSLVEDIKTNDEALLRFAFLWLRFALFAEPTFKAREGASEPRRKE